MPYMGVKWRIGVSTSTKGCTLSVTIEGGTHTSHRLVSREMIVDRILQAASSQDPRRHVGICHICIYHLMV